MSPAVPSEEPNNVEAWLLSAVQAGVVAMPGAEPRYTKARPSSVWPLSYSGAPAITSAYPSPLTSPAVATAAPRCALAWLLSAVDDALFASPEADPRYTKMRPSSVWPLSYRSAPTTTPAYPSPLTSPAAATDAPKSALAWLLSAVQA